MSIKELYQRFDELVECGDMPPGTDREIWVIEQWAAFVDYGYEQVKEML